MSTAQAVPSGSSSTPCPRCEGTGAIHVVTETGGYAYPCPDCSGEGSEAPGPYDPSPRVKAYLDAAEGESDCKADALKADVLAAEWEAEAAYVIHSSVLDRLVYANGETWVEALGQWPAFAPYPTDNLGVAFQTRRSPFLHADIVFYAATSRVVDRLRIVPRDVLEGGPS